MQNLCVGKTKVDATQYAGREHRGRSRILEPQIGDLANMKLEGLAFKRFIIHDSFLGSMYTSELVVYVVVQIDRSKYHPRSPLLPTAYASPCTPPRTLKASISAQSQANLKERMVVLSFRKASSVHAFHYRTLLQVVVLSAIETRKSPRGVCRPDFPPTVSAMSDGQWSVGSDRSL